MLEKVKNVDFGRCPRVLCSGQPCLPVGQSDIPRTATVKIFCPKCGDIYFPRSKYQANIDGAYFGTTFPHLFLMTYAYLKPPRPTQSFVPRIFGFRIHKSANSQDNSKHVHGSDKRRRQKLAVGDSGGAGTSNNGSSGLASVGGDRGKETEKGSKSSGK